MNILQTLIDATYKYVTDCDSEHLNTVVNFTELGAGFITLDLQLTVCNQQVYASKKMSYYKIIICNNYI